jgi:hypothetical protein
VYEKYDMVESRNYPGKPTSWYPRPDTWRLDVVKVGPNGRPEKFYDMKFPGDDPKQNEDWERRKRAYEAIAEKQPEKATQGESKSLGEQFRDWDRLPEKPSIGPDGSPPKPPSMPPVFPPLPGMPPIPI